MLLNQQSLKSMHWRNKWIIAPLIKSLFQNQSLTLATNRNLISLTDSLKSFSQLALKNGGEWALLLSSQSFRVCRKCICFHERCWTQSHTENHHTVQHTHGTSPHTYSHAHAHSTVCCGTFCEARSYVKIEFAIQMILSKPYCAREDTIQVKMGLLSSMCDFLLLQFCLSHLVHCLKAFLCLVIRKRLKMTNLKEG